MPVELPKDPRFEISIVYQPLQEVGGDWHYSSITKSGKLSLQILDVTGHGLDAALLGSMTRLALFVVDKESPDQLFHEMNRLMVPQLPSGRFVTAAAILFDPSNGEILFSRAGHPPGYILRGKSKEVETLQASGFALGFVDEAEYVVDKTILEPGDFVVLYTDGLVESQNRDNKLFGFDGLEASLRRCSEQMSVSELLAVLKEDLYNFLDGRLIKDDVTIIGLKRVC